MCCKLKCKLDKCKQNCVEAPDVSTGNTLCVQLCYFEILIYCITLMMMTMMIHEAKVLIRKSATSREVSRSIPSDVTGDSFRG